jgi:hypothetical protein
MSRVGKSDERLRRDRRRWYYPPVSSFVAAFDAEWRAAPLGRLGHVLWADIERYLEFMAIARADIAEGATPAHASSERGHAVTYLGFR